MEDETGDIEDELANVKVGEFEGNCFKCKILYDMQYLTWWDEITV